MSLGKIRHIGTFAWFMSVLVAAFVVIGIAMPGHKAAAGSCGPDGIGWFSGNDYSCDAYGAGGSDVDPGHFSSGDTSKSAFINDIENSPDAKFYVTIITGNSHNGRPSGSEWTQDKQDFEDAVNNPDIGIQATPIKTRNNSMQIDGDYVFYQMGSSISPSTLVLYSKSKGTQYTEIKIDCGNPLNQTPLPKPNKPTGNFTSVTCSAGNYTIAAKWDDKDAPADNGANAYITATGGTKKQVTKTANSGTGTWTVSTLTFTNSDWPIELYVQDYPGSTYLKVDTNDQPSCGGPGGKISATCNTSGVSYSGSFYDQNGATTAKVTGGGFNDSYTSARSNKSAATAKSISHSNSTHPTGSVTLTLSVADSRGGKKPPYTVSVNATCPGTTTTPLSGLCPNNAVLNANSTVLLGLADATPSGDGSDAPGSTTSPGSIYTQNVSEKRTRIDSATTSLPNPSGLSPGSLMTNAMVGGEANPYNQVKFDWTKYMTTYPYDNNDATVGFTSYYKQSIYRAHSSVDFYSCPGGGSLSGATCDPSYGASAYPVYKTVCTTTSGVKTCDPYVVDYYVYYCPSGGGLSGYTCVKPKYTATKNYNYTQISGPTEKQATGSSSYAQGAACYYRNFQVNAASGVQVTSPVLSPTQENPTSANTSSATATVTFLIKHGGAIRLPYAVNGLTYTSQMYGQGGMDCPADGGGTFNVSGPSSGSGVTGSRSLPGITCAVVPIPQIGSQACAEYNVSPTGEEIDQSGTIQTSNGLTAVGIGCSVPVRNEAYVRVFGGDVSAGNGFTSGATCDSSSTAQILTFNAGPNRYGGSGTDLAALAPQSIGDGSQDSGFATAQTSITSPPPLAPKGLSFANSTSSFYGGDYGTSPNCVPDYYDASSGPTSALPSTDVAMLDGAHSTSTAINGLSGTVPTGKHVVIYSSKDVYINGPIMTAAGSITNIGDVPSFTLIIKGGNLYIDSGVINLSGSYIVQPSAGVGGVIYTCASGLGRLVADGNKFGTCGSKLTVNGSFIANSIHMNRLGANGSLRFSGTDSGPGSTNASEEFDYTPFNWLGQLPPTGKPPKYDSITSLPPVL